MAKQSLKNYLIIFGPILLIILLCIIEMSK